METFICSGNVSPAWCNGLVKRQKEEEKKIYMKRTNCKCDVKMDMQPTRSATSLTFLKLFIHRKKKNVEDKKKKKKK